MTLDKFVCVRIKRTDREMLDQLRAEGQSFSGIVSELLRYFIQDETRVGSRREKMTKVEPCNR